ncbi:serine hydrolase [Duganella sp. Root336D2]|uniref:serine hydrolase domain-containing protein n=1 Tax=Duganella sp. Root336D2 TaxID=1736518 RepID=UPI0006F93653|nr:serine hydrolase domain-containing protein [Duganella sp. Root336D2]KQV43053.1 serine hydrolase [Duganella sp. Root336D2]
MRKAMRAWFGAVLLGCLGPASAGALDRELAAIVNDAQRPLSSLSVLAVRDGKVAYQQQFGLRRLDTTGSAAAAPVTPQTMFRIASISKMMTSFGVMKLVEEGRLKLDTDVGEYLGFALRNPNYPAQAITLRHLLSHTSTLRDDAGYFWRAGTALREVLVPDGRMWARDGEPGQYFTYSNLNWAVIGTAMEHVTGERFDRLMQHLLLAPMGLRGGYNPAAFSQQEVADTATLYRRRTRESEIWDSKGAWIAQVDDFGVAAPQEPAGLDKYVIGTNATPFSPTGGMRMSASDMGRIMLMLINNGRHAGRQILKPASLALMFGEQWRFNGNNGNTLKGLYHSWGLGIQRFADVRGNMGGMPQDGRFTAICHLGEAYGLVATFAVDLKKKQGIVSLIGGFGSDPDTDPGLHSAHTRAEERILEAIYQRAILGRGD